MISRIRSRFLKGSMKVWRWRHKNSEEDWTQSDNPGEKKRRRRGKMVGVGVEVGSCSVDNESGKTGWSPLWTRGEMDGFTIFLSHLSGKNPANPLRSRCCTSTFSKGLRWVQEERKKSKGENCTSVWCCSHIMRIISGFANPKLMLMLTSNAVAIRDGFCNQNCVISIRNCENGSPLRHVPSIHHRWVCFFLLK